MATHTGSCHCGKVRYTVEGEIGDVLECNCSHCSRKGFLLWFVPRATLKIEGKPALTSYFFNKHVIEHTFCPTCGTQPFGYGKGRDGAETAAINVRCLEDVDLASVKRVPFDGRKL